jgi:membrane-associated phospholipid phosphatase
MPTPQAPPLTTAADYNRTAPGAAPENSTLPWLYLLIGLALAAAFLRFDGPISRTLHAIPLKGDLRREIESLQQYGQGLSSILILLAIWLQDPARRRRLADGLAAYAATALVVIPLKGLVGRPRPEFDDPLYFLGPLGEYPLAPPIGLRHAWEVWGGISSKLWSMPSSHTAYAAALGLFVATLYPRLRPLMFALIAFVGMARVVTGAHYPSDVVIGAAIGLTMTQLACDRRWGQRLLARVLPPIQSAAA